MPVKTYIIHVPENALKIIESIPQIYEDFKENEIYKNDKRRVRRLPLTAISEITGLSPKTIKNNLKQIKNLTIKGVA